MAVGPRLSLGELTDLLGNDVKIVDSTAKRAENGRYYLVFPADLMPDGREFLGEVPERLDPSILREWCETVRREANARIDRQEAAATRRNDNGSGVVQQPDTTPANTGGWVGSAKAGGEERKETLEETLRRKVVEAEAERDLRKQVCNQANEQWLLASAALADSESELKKARDVLTFLIGGTDRSAHEDSGKDSVQPVGSKKKGRGEGSN